jgi:cell division protein FtsB
MGALKTTLKIIGFICLVLFSIYAVFISDNKNLSWYPIIAWVIVFCYWWLDDRDRAKAREEEKFQRLSARVAYLERKIETLDR